MSAEDRDEETFLATLGQGGRVTVPYAVRERLGLKQGYFLRVRVRREKAKG